MKYLKSSILGLLLTLCCSNAWAQFGPASPMVLVTDIDFSCPSKAADEFGSFNEVGDFGGILKPSSIISGVNLAETTEFTVAASDFLSDPQYAIVSNPIVLDSLRMDDKDVKGAVFTNVSQGTILMSFSVGGLKDDGNYEIEIDYYLPHSKKYLNTAGDAPKPHLSGGYSCTFKAVANPDTEGNRTAGTSSRFTPSAAYGASGTLKLTNASSQCGKISGGTLDVFLSAERIPKGEAIMITGIRVKAQIDPRVASSGSNRICRGGEQIVLSPKMAYAGCTYKWYKEGVAVGTNSSYIHVSGEVVGKKTTYNFEVTTPDGKTVGSDKYVVEDIKCCDDPLTGASMSRKQIWVDNFGVFTSPDSYWVWDYSDGIAEPKKITLTGEGYRHKLDDAPLGTTYVATGPVDTKNYTVAAQISSGQGSKLGWSADLGGKNNQGVLPDHSGDLNGAALFINVPASAGTGQVVYQRTIDGLCTGVDLTVYCYFSIFTTSCAGVYAPANVKLKIIDSRGVEHITPETVEFAPGESVNWKESFVEVENNPGESITLQVLDYSNNPGECGNDLVIDDIIIYGCAAPTVDMYFDLNTFAEDTVTCDGIDNKVDLFVNPSKMLKDYYKDLHYIYQYSKTPDDKKSWKNIEGPIEEDVLEGKVAGVISSLGLEDGDELYVRVVAANKTEMALHTDNYYNPDDPCGSFSISPAIKVEISCPRCTPSKEIEISSDVASTTVRGKKTVRLCKDEKVVLTSNDVAIIPEGKTELYSNFFMTWSIDGVDQTNVVRGSVADPFEITWDMASAGGTAGIEVVLTSSDADYPTSTSCMMTDEFIVIANPEVDDKIQNDKPEFCEGKG
ncbi:MAG: hypothetical protein MJZ00_04935, partial [Paludibacteraceae bacterium]|nr:hypothetical protein [Paludibacteraceae bacterium]